jgi:hypothetical protein
MKKLDINKLKSLFEQVSKKKKFRVLNIEESTMSITNQEILVVELSEIKYMDIDLSSDKKPYTFSPIGEIFVLPINSSFSKNIIQLAENEEIVLIDLSDYIKREENKNNSLQTIYYHNTIQLI